jgi:hypothetical protein
LSTPFDGTDCLLIVGLALGKTQEQAGAWAVDASHPQGLTARSVRTRMKEKAEAYEAIIPRVKAEVDRIRTIACDEVKDLTAKEFMRENERALGLAAAVRRRILEQGVTSFDPEILALAGKTASEVTDRQLGKPKQQISVDRSNVILVFNPIPLQQAKREEIDTIESKLLLREWLPDLDGAEIPDDDDDAQEAEVVG